MTKYQTNTGTDKIIFYIIGAVTLVVLALIIVFSINEGKQTQTEANITAFSAKDSEKPKISVSNTFFDLGVMKAKDEKTAEFTIENKGNKPLSLFKISSSCDCTFAQIEIKGNKSPEFTMHSKSPWTGTIEPGGKALLSVIYRPFIMPVKGVVTRDVYMETNDPTKGRMTFTVKANVE
ncbi:MAG: hypothetical protein UT63_C0015G0003 [Candidatus Gottesmanbacteria bacterium GW2011_GWC2_39_8]|uniref:HYDIN/VesB/CFA65-like Ig-like domain-containing protein n=1 Tax=Candidatus Gottesmanbacteria bacterium GW2011_GWC2_39_8 TaxID=1618450 RepID=A0A0G0T6P8_9BACT|nr:MAG: hypothetical protein UT63_C0015G0003 [Candidatus Gottesmanbacteria bacterium GW2011_GWC2_39_8]